MKQYYTSGALLCSSTLFFVTWYFFLYQQIDHYIAHQEKIVNTCIKNCSRIQTLQRKCKAEQGCIASLNTQCNQQCNTIKNEIDDESIMSTITSFLQNHKLALINYKRISKDKKEWYTQHKALLIFQGSIQDIFAFFDTLSQNKKGIIPTHIELNTDNKNITHVTTHISWIVVK